MAREKDGSLMGYRYRRKRKASYDLGSLILEEWRVGMGLVVLSMVAALWTLVQVDGNPDERATAFLEQIFPKFAWVFEYALPLFFLALGILFLWATWFSWSRSQDRYEY
jgi:hypothetical protein